MKKSTISSKFGLVAVFLFCAALFYGCAGELADQEARLAQIVVAEEEEAKLLIAEPFLIAEPCPPELLRPVLELDAKIAWQIKYDFFARTVNSDTLPPGLTLYDMKIDSFYGVYNGYVVVRVSGPHLNYMTVITQFTVEGMTFVYNDSHVPLLWKLGDPESDVHTIPAAFALDILTIDDVRNIHLRHVGPPATRPPNPPVQTR